jgi:anti-sigma regulatory factor (Ser/Thr protein kinase)
VLPVTADGRETAAQLARQAGQAAPGQAVPPRQAAPRQAAPRQAGPGQAVPPRQNRARQPLLQVLPGKPESASQARQLARDLLGDSPATETVMLLVSELVSNAIQHSRSGEPGGTVTVALCPTPAAVLIQVRDDGGPSRPCVADSAGGEAERGYGLVLVDTLADSWATISSPDGRLTWCKVSGVGHDQQEWNVAPETRGPA